MGSKIGKSLALSLLALLLTALAAAVAWAPLPAAAQEVAQALDPSIVRWGLVAAAVATGISTLAAGYAVAVVGSAGIGALAEKPELMGRVLVLVGLAEGIAIYGLIVSILILNRIG